LKIILDFGQLASLAFPSLFSHGLCSLLVGLNLTLENQAALVCVLVCNWVLIVFEYQLQLPSISASNSIMINIGVPDLNLLRLSDKILRQSNTTGGKDKLYFHQIFGSFICCLLFPNSSKTN